MPTIAEGASAGGQFSPTNHDVKITSWSQELDDEQWTRRSRQRAHDPTSCAPAAANRIPMGLGGAPAPPPPPPPPTTPLQIDRSMVMGLQEMPRGQQSLQPGVGGPQSNAAMTDRLSGGQPARLSLHNGSGMNHMTRSIYDSQLTQLSVPPGLDIAEPIHQLLSCTTPTPRLHEDYSIVKGRMNSVASNTLNLASSL
ncbi:unnamed protein product, partial [Amoebophrya sp. A25]|eukprot:GSA25T00002593001.1